MISTNNLNSLPNKDTLRNICKSISVLDAIFSQEWEDRYYSYNHEWGENEALFEMQNGEGDQLLILFRNEGCVMNGFSHELYDSDKNLPSKEKLTKRLPKLFEEFIFGEPIATVGTTFCIWTVGLNNWQIGQVENFEDGSNDMLYIFDGNPQTYIDWAMDYYEDSYKEGGIPLETVNRIYKGKTLTKEMVFSIVDEFDDWEQLAKDLENIDYSYDFD